MIAIALPKTIVKSDRLARGSDFIAREAETAIISMLQTTGRGFLNAQVKAAFSLGSGSNESIGNLDQAGCTAPTDITVGLSIVHHGHGFEMFGLLTKLSSVRAFKNSSRSRTS